MIISEATLIDQILHAGFPARRNRNGEWETTTQAVAKFQSPPLSKDAKEAKKKAAAEAKTKDAATTKKIKAAPDGQPTVLPL